MRSLREACAARIINRNYLAAHEPSSLFCKQQEE